MRLQTLLACVMTSALAALTPAGAQRPPAPGPWELLGQQTVGFGVDSDRILVNQSEEWFRERAYRTLRFVAEGNDVHLISIRIVYLNGYSEDVQTDRLIPRGGQLLVDLKGERSYLRQVDMRYRSRLGVSIGGGGIRLQQAVVKVYGERVLRRPGPPPVAGLGWTEIETRRVSRGDDRVVLSASFGEGRFGQIKLRSLADPVRIVSLDIRFRNGETQAVRIDRRLAGGEETPAIDLMGRQRLVDTVTVHLDPRRRWGRPGELQLLATSRPGEEPSGDPYAGRGWILLGEQTVGFGVDRDVINVGQPEDWFRNRAFRALHLVAERSEIHMVLLRIVYFNGYEEELRIDRFIPVGGDLAVDLRGERSYLRRIEMTYRSRPGFRGQAVVKVYGEPVRR
jgi:hypothetical protein